MSTLHASQELINLIKQVVLNSTYPIGNIIVTTNNKNPSTYLGGTWSKIGTGRTLFAANDDSQLGKTVESGLPNITGHIDPRWIDSSGGGIMMAEQHNGALYNTRPSGHGYWWAATTVAFENSDANNQYKTRICFDASGSNRIYGRSNIVQPPAVYVYFWKRTA